MKARVRVRRVGQVFAGLILLDAAASVVILWLGVPLPRPSLSPSHPRMAQARLEQLLDKGTNQSNARPSTQPHTHRCAIDQSGGWDYVCQKGISEIGYYDVSATTITKRSVIETHGHQVVLIRSARE